MAVTVARVHLAMEHAAMPGLLPTPPEWKMLPLLPTPPCATAVILPTPTQPKPGRADAVDRWDASKNTLNKSASKPGRADAAERWDARKITLKSSSGKNSPDGKNKGSSISSSCERWDMNKKSPTSFSSSSSSSSSSPTSRAVATSSCKKWERTKRAVSRGSSSSTERWDAHKKKPRPPLKADGRDVADEDDGQSSTGSNDMEVDDEPQPQMGLYAGPGFLAVTPPEPSPILRRAHERHVIG